MHIQLIVKPSDEPMSWDTFCARTGPYAVALDGYVNEGPRYDPVAPRINFNHHEGVERLATHATCAQALITVRMGLYWRFRDENGPRIDAYVNDCDEDVGTSWTVLRNPDVVHGPNAPALNRLVGMVDVLDSTAGAYPYPADLPSLETLNWIFETYRAFRATGEIDKRDADAFRQVILESERRFLQAIVGRGERIPLDARYEKLGGGPIWTLFRERGVHGRVGAFADGVKAYVIARERSDGAMAYTIGRISQFIPFDVPALIAALNRAEGDAERLWGCGNTVGGSNRAHGSLLPPESVEKIINDASATL